MYIGRADDLNRRFNEHTSCLNRGKHHSVYLRNSWKKYGEDNFVFGVLEYCEIPNLKEREQFYLDKYRPFDPSVGFNESPFSTGGIKTHSEETRKKLSQKRLGTKTPEEIKQKIGKGVRDYYAQDREAALQKLAETNGSEFDIISPSEELIKIKGLSQFARKNNLNPLSLYDLKRGRMPYLKGWRLSTTPPIPNYKLKDMYGTEHLIQHGKQTEFATKHGLTLGTLSSLIAGSRIYYNGWILSDTKLENKILIDPNGNKHDLSYPNIGLFCKNNGLLPNCVFRLVKGDIIKYKGWILG